MALAREVDLQAHYVWVVKDFRGRLVAHACAGVLLGRRALLVDPAYRWFGIPHREYQFLDDLQAIGAYLAQSGSIARDRVAEKLLPDQAWVPFNLAMGLAREGRFNEARRALEDGRKLDSNSWRTPYAQGVVDVFERRGSSAIEHLRDCLRIQPDYSLVHYYLATAYEMNGDLREARDEFRNYLQGETVQERAVKARRAIAKIDRVIGSENRTGHTASRPAFYEKRAEALIDQGRYAEAIAECTEAIKLDAADSTAYALRGSARTMNGDISKALEDLNEATRLDPKAGKNFDRRGYAHMQEGDFAQAVEDFRAAITLNPGDSLAYAHLAWLRACCRDASFRSGKEAVEAAKRACELKGRPEWSYVATLAAAHSETGDFDAAIRCQKQVLDMEDLPQGVRAQMEPLLRLYEQHKPYHGDPK